MIAKFSSPVADVDPDSNYFNEIFTSVDGAIQSDYYTIDNFNSKFSKSSADFFIVNANIRSFSKNIDNFLNDLNTWVVVQMQLYWRKHVWMMIIKNLRIFLAISGFIQLDWTGVVDESLC